MTERELSNLQKEYQSFFLEKLKSYEVISPSELTKKQKSKFFASIKRDWSKIKLANKENAILVRQGYSVHQNDSKQIIIDIVTELPPESIPLNPNSFSLEPKRQKILSLPNEDQTNNLKIMYSPNSYFEQLSKYCYPVVKMPKDNASLKLPRLGRTSNRGYKEKEFSDRLKLHVSDLQIAENVHMVIPNFSRPYEPDIVLFDKKLNLYIDIEIDEPYDGYYRYPTHCIMLDKPIKQDDIRDLFFTESGWVVIRFTERQVHLQALECIDHIKNVINSLRLVAFNNSVKCETEFQWDQNQCIQWQKINYREKYLGIVNFHKNYNGREIEIDTSENEDIEEIIKRTKKYDFLAADGSNLFDKKTPIFFHSKDRTGNAEYISVTALIERFFPFDLKRYIEKKAFDENRAEEEVLIEFLMIRDEAAERGTYLHNQIENYLKEREFIPDFTEFDLFLSFFNNEIKARNLQFYDAEKRIVSKRYNVAGTIDCLFKKSDKEEFVMLDWKRSKKLIIDGRPRLFGYGYALSELNHFDNSSYNKYCLQQNIYKYIAENEYGIKISSMKLVVLHDEYSTYYVVNVPNMPKETKIILNSLKHKI
ncbi:hypothetical protein [Pedobacter hiemivivus]|uniref:DUF559 domain-containing protein n=1 Tax=Pedobacter hiemivivus TaxID=2530454 RepID=A0A4V2MKM0_9SPHI|nr:hypothetical protein [Pedobacter hiemivivus]TCC98726.1 hypothetical protein EZ444_05465 [Pedobacter hiemivivus]